MGRFTVKARHNLGIAVICGAALWSAACARKPAVDQAKLEVFKALPAVMDSASNPITEDKVNLGRMLYYDPRLSRGQDVSCNTCHELAKYGVDADAEPTSTGFKGQKGSRNSPSVYNAAGHFVQFWDGRAATVEEQAKGPILNPVEMAMPDQKRVVAVLRSMPEYRSAAFKERTWLQSLPPCSTQTTRSPPTPTRRSLLRRRTRRGSPRR